MTDICELGTQREKEVRADALADQRRKSGIVGKTINDSADECQVCDDPIPDARRRALPGVQTCVYCQTELERGVR